MSSSDGGTSSYSLPWYDSEVFSHRRQEALCSSSSALRERETLTPKTPKPAKNEVFVVNECMIVIFYVCSTTSKSTNNVDTTSEIPWQSSCRARISASDVPAKPG